jgi:hypothetical protein
MIYVDEIKNNFIRYQYPGDVDLSYIYVLEAEYTDNDRFRMKSSFYFNFFSRTNTIRVVKNDAAKWFTFNEDYVNKIDEKDYYRYKMFSYIFNASKIIIT